MRGLTLVLACLLAGCADSPASAPTAPESTDAADEAAREARSKRTVVDQETGAGFSTSQESFDYTTPSWSVADQSFMNPTTGLRGSPPEDLAQTLIEARIAPEPSMGGWSMRAYEQTGAPVGQTAPPLCSSGDLGRTDQPDDDGVYRIVLAADTWRCNTLAVIFYSSGQPAGIITQAHVDVWTTTFEGMEMPDNFTAVPA